MSRTIRIKNNFREHVLDTWNSRNYEPHWNYFWVDGAELGEDPNYLYKVKRNSTDKADIFRAYKYLHGDGKAYGNRSGNKKIKRTYVKLYNKADRAKARNILACLNTENVEDTFIDIAKGKITKGKKVPWWFYD